MERLHFQTSLPPGKQAFAKPIDLSRHPAGVYLLTVKCQAGIWSQRLVLTR